MKFSTREDIEAPIDHVFAQISDFAGFERRALRQGADVRRLGDGPSQVGTQWDVSFKLRGRDRQMQVTLSALEVPEMYQIDATSDGMNAETLVELVALSPRRTRLAVAIDLRPRSLTARVLLQSMKLAKTKLNKRFKARVLEYAEEIEDSYRKQG
jgi:hypothetical protein